MIQEMRGYRHIEEKDRRRIAKLKSYKLSVSEIARRTGFNKSTISRELKRNGHQVDFDLTDEIEMFEVLGCDYEAELLRKKRRVRYWSYTRKADIVARWRRSLASRRSRVNQETQQWIALKLKAGWSPQQIAGRSRAEGKQTVSHEYVYQFILKDKKQGGRLYRLLKRFGKRKQRLGQRQYSQPPIINRVSITERPREANLRSRAGDLEGDLIFGYKQGGYILSVIDRKTRLLALEKLKTKKQSEVKEAFLRAIKRMPEAKTLTLDNAREFNCHTDLSRQTGVQVYFADPYCSHQRGSIENANGLVRYYLPKKTDFKSITRKELKEIEQRLNDRPRRILGYLTPKEVATNSMASHA